MNGRIDYDATSGMNYTPSPFRKDASERYMNRIEKLKNDLYSFEELITLEKNASKLNDSETLGLIAISRASKTAKGEKPKPIVAKAEKPQPRRARRQKN